jgi:hypothetical protein
MADWRQVQARIRKAKTSAEPLAQLTELFERTHDAMVAFELATFQEKLGDSIEAVRWYTAAAERFRRPQWRTKAEEAMTRLGAPIPAPLPAAAAALPPAESHSAEQETEQRTEEEAAKPPVMGSEGAGEVSAEGGEAPQPAGGSPAAAGRRRRHRGRRGGRRRRGERAEPAAGAGTHGVTPLSRPASPAPETFRPSHSPMGARTESYPEEAPAHESAEPPAAVPASAPLWQGRARAGEPALASRISQLESQLRRLLACPLASLEDADQAPAGPGVLLLSDSDQHTHYYIEACQTLRIGIGNLLRGGRGSKEAGRLKGCMADNLGIAEARVSKYLKDHCAVRWLQLDEGAPELAHFATAVLRPVVNE